MFKQDTKKFIIWYYIDISCAFGQIYDCIDKDNFPLVQWLQVWVSVYYRLMHSAYDVLIINFVFEYLKDFAKHVSSNPSVLTGAHLQG